MAGQATAVHVTGDPDDDNNGLFYLYGNHPSALLRTGLGSASADTIVPNPTDPQSFNRYSYVQNNPLKFTDPTGHYVAEANNANPCHITNACTDSDGYIIDNTQKKNLLQKKQ